MMRKILFLFGLIVMANLTIASDNMKAKELFESSKQKLSLKNVHLVLDLVTLDSKGNSKDKVLSVSFGEFNQEKKVMVEIIAPEKVKGTKILTTNYLNKKGIIEIFMPATGKIQKFRASNRNLKLMGSEIPIAQFSSVVESEYVFELLGSQDVDGESCHKIKVTKPDEKDYRIAFISMDKELLVRIEKYDMNNKILSLTQLEDYIVVKNSENKLYPKVINVRNFSNGKSSSMKIRELEYVKQLNEADFQIPNKQS